MTIFSTGFRIFFPLAALAALFPVLAWVMLFGTGSFESTYYGTEIWHGHEMLFGYAVAVITGFLLTAVRNWTHKPTAQGPELAMLALLWLAGRVAPFLDGVVPRPLIATLDLVFLPALAIVVLHPIVLSRQWHNLVFPLLLAILAALNAVIHAEAIGAWIDVAENALEAAVLVGMAMISVLGGRVIPRFTENAVGGGFRAVRRDGIEAVALPSILVLGFVIVLQPESAALAACAVFAAAVHAIRLAGWYTPAIRRDPLLWILHLGYAWLCAGFVLYALAPSLIAVHVAVHALTVGALGSITIGMMARVSLGHTARPLVAPRPAVAAFVLVNLAALVRVFGFILAPDAMAPVVQVSGVLWCAAFVLFLVSYAPVWSGPRRDGLPD